MRKSTGNLAAEVQRFVPGKLALLLHILKKRDAVNQLHHEWIDPEKPVKSVVSQMNDSSVDFKLFVWADAVKKSYVISDVLKCVYDTLGKNGIEIPFPQRDVHIIQ